eukprot:8686353-Alexandrium_andersonii.AAC.1
MCIRDRHPPQQREVPCRVHDPGGGGAGTAARRHGLSELPRVGEEDLRRQLEIEQGQRQGKEGGQR